MAPIHSVHGEVPNPSLNLVPSEALALGVQPAHLQSEALLGAVRL